MFESYSTICLEVFTFFIELPVYLCWESYEYKYILLKCKSGSEYYLLKCTSSLIPHYPSRGPGVRVCVSYRVFMMSHWYTGNDYRKPIYNDFIFKKIPSFINSIFTVAYVHILEIYANELGHENNICTNCVIPQSIRQR